jgi:hypothetical protein
MIQFFCDAGRLGLRETGFYLTAWKGWQPHEAALGLT